MDDVIDGAHLQIIAYDRPAGNRRKNEVDSFTVDFNPNTFSVNNKIEFQKADAKGSAGSDPQFDKIPPLEFTVEFTLDGTGVAAKRLAQANRGAYNNQKQNYVKTKIKELRSVTGCEINGEIHRPNYVGLLWGTFDIKCVLTSLSIVYNLFDREGTPLRAKVTCNFLERLGPGEGSRASKFESPDLTKQVIVKEGDTLPLISKDKYESSSYYIQLAKANKLRNFRRLSPGMKLKLPPMADNDE
jgi:nucleoid-associated protein YgaU